MGSAWMVRGRPHPTRAQRRVPVRAAPGPRDDPPGSMSMPSPRRDQTVTSRLRARLSGRTRFFDANASPFRRGVERDRPLALVNVIGVLAVLVGIMVMTGSRTWGFDLGRALGAIVGQLGATLWPALAVSLAVTLQVLAGASVVRVLRWSAYRSLSELVVVGAVAAIAVDLLLLVILGPLGLFHWLTLLPIMVLLTLLGTIARPFLSPGVLRAPRVDWAAWLLVGLVWTAPVVLQLASPLAPFVDVLPNHVAPVEHLRTFGSWDALAVSPSPIYGPSRVFLGYVAPLGVTAILSGQDAGMAVAAFALPMTVLFAAAGRLLARTIGSQRAARGLGPARDFHDPTDDPDATAAAYWVLLTLPLTFAFLRLPDTRATVLAFVPAALALVITMDAARWGGRSRPGMLAVTIGAGILVHPAIGALTAGTVAVIGVLSATRTRTAFAGIAGGLVIAAPALLVAAGVTVTPLIALPPMLAGVTLAAAMGGRASRDDWSMPRPAGSALRVRELLVGLSALLMVLAGLALLMALRPDPMGAAMAALAGVVDWILLLVALVPFIALGRGRLVLGSAVVVGMAAGLGAAALGGLLPATDLLAQSLAYELPKSAGYWVPWALAIAGGIGLAALWAMRDLPGWARVGAVSAFVVLSAVSFRPDALEPEAIEQHRYAETLAVSLVNAQDGYWIGYPDGRRVLDGPRRDLVEAVRAEISAGRLHATTPVLHVAPTFQQWETTPLGVFAGVLETTATPDAERSIHTLGGRLERLEDLARLLGPAFPYVVVEGYGQTMVDRVLAAGYEEIWRSDRAVLLRRPSTG